MQFKLSFGNLLQFITDLDVELLKFLVQGIKWFDHRPGYDIV